MTDMFLCLGCMSDCSCVCASSCSGECQSHESISVQVQAKSESKFIEQIQSSGPIGLEICEPDSKGYVKIQ